MKETDLSIVKALFEANKSDLTSTSRAMLEFVFGYSDDHRRFPTNQEIGTQFNVDAIAAKAAVDKALHALQKKAFDATRKIPLQYPAGAEIDYSPRVMATHRG